MRAVRPQDRPALHFPSLGQSRANLPAGRMKTLAYDKAADDGNITGARRFHAFVGAVMVVHLAFATLLAKAPRWEGTLGQTRLGPVAEALRQPPPAQAAG